jgi:hypothetical protein
MSAARLKPIIATLAHPIAPDSQLGNGIGSSVLRRADAERLETDKKVASSSSRPSAGRQWSRCDCARRLDLLLIQSIIRRAEPTEDHQHDPVGRAWVVREGSRLRHAFCDASQKAAAASLPYG